MELNEIVIKKFHPHPLYHFVFYFSGVLIFISGFFFTWYLLLVGVLIFVLGEVARISETFYVLESGIAREYKLIATSRDFTEYSKIQNIKVRQGFIERIFRIGNIHIDTAGGDKSEVNFHGVPDPYAVESIIRGKMKIL